MRRCRTCCAPHPDQIAALRPGLTYSAEDLGGDGLRIAYSPDQGYARIDPDVRANTEAALDVIRSRGAVVEEVDLAFDEEAMEAATLKLLLSSAMGAMLLQVAESGHTELLTGYARHFVDMVAERSGPIQLAEGQAYAAHMHSQDDALFADGFDAFVCPTTTTSAVPADFDFLTDSLEVSGAAVDPLSGWILTPAFNLIYTGPRSACRSGWTATVCPRACGWQPRPSTTRWPSRSPQPTLQVRHRSSRESCVRSFAATPPNAQRTLTTWRS